MNLRYTPRPWVIISVLFCISAIKPLRSEAQCAGTIKSTTYTVVLNGNGSNTYTVNSIPQYPVAGPTLLSVVVKGIVTATSSETFTDPVGGSPADFFPQISRSDVIKLNGTTLGAPGGTAYNGIPETILNPGQSISYPSSTIFNNVQDYYDSVKSVNPVFPSFSGAGNLSLTYKSASFLNGVPLGVSGSAIATESISFSVTYYYCFIPLATNVLTFTATRADNHRVQLDWTSSNEEAGSRYDIEASRDGSAFSEFDSRQAIANHIDASYSDTYSIPPGATGNLYFRLKMVNADGTVSYSQVKVINLDAVPAATGFHIYPDPPDAGFINIVFGTASSDWQVDIFSASGILEQRNYFYNATTARVDFRNAMPSGAYFVRATDQQAGKNYTASFLIRK